MFVKTHLCCRCLFFIMEFRKEIYHGSIKIFKSVKSAKKLCTYFRDKILPKHDLLAAPGATHNNTSEEIRANACKEFENDPITSLLWKDIIDEVNIHSTDSSGELKTSTSSFAWDRVRLRVQQSDAGYDDITNSLNSFGRYSSTLPLHRDTWASQVMQQLNWWMPLLEIDENRTLAIYPNYFNQAVPNTTDTWSLEILKQKRKKKIPYPQLPQLLTEELNDDEWAKLEKDKKAMVVNPGDVLVFSGNHLHGSVINNTGLTRFSSEIRTVHINDVIRNVGANNVDGYPHGYHLEWFHCVVTETENIEVVENDHKKCEREARQIKKGMNLKKVVKKKKGLLK